MLMDKGLLTLRTEAGRQEQFLLRQCAIDDLDAIMRAQESVYSSLEQNHIFALTTREEISESLNIDFCIGAFCGGELAAFTLMVTNRLTYRNLGNYLGYTQDRLLHCVTYDTTFVLPDYRGFGIQRLFCAIRDKVAIELGAQEALATVSPDNTVSLKNIKANGFKILAEKTMYTGVQRYIVGKKLVDSAAEKGAKYEPWNISGS